MKIRNWIFPVNPDSLDKKKVEYPRKYRSKFFIEMGNEYSAVLVNNSNLEESLNLFLNLVKDKKFHMHPEINFWKEFTENHKVYMVKHLNEYIGIFCTDKLSVKLSKKCEIEHGNTLFCVGKQPETVKSMIQTCKKDGYEMLMLQERGDLNKYLLNKIMAINAGLTDYLNFYNCRIELSPRDIYAPLL